jgi:hypothetical protein
LAPLAQVANLLADVIKPFAQLLARGVELLFVELPVAVIVERPQNAFPRDRPTRRIAVVVIVFLGP